ncbi:MAG TPA: signal peptidase I [Beijerinckiaceae bacterium]|nr:signal peptidase I [Beijerinckiaceae bacterium]
MTEATTRNSAARKSEGGVLELVWIVIQALLIALVVRTLLFQPFNIPSGSLVPTLLVGDYLFVSKYSYGYSKYSLPLGLPLFEGRIMASEPKRGDIAVFKLPKDSKTDYIKRVIGLPGDRIQMIDARLYINGQETQRTPLPPYHTIDDFGRPVDVPHYMETLPNGVSHEIIQKNGDSGYWSNTPVYTVPPEHYFMMGDNRDNSQDSRVLSEVGYVPFENFEGRAEIIFFSIDENASAWKLWEWPSTVRWNRIFQHIK